MSGERAAQIVLAEAQKHEHVRRLTPAKAWSVLVGSTAELVLDRCCPNCAAALSA